MSVRRRLLLTAAIAAGTASSVIAAPAATDVITDIGVAAGDGDRGFGVHDLAMLVLGVAMLLTVGRLVRGPTLADRVIALDLLAFFAAGIVAIAAVVADRSELLMVAVVIALLTFMGTAAFALYLERRAHEDAR